MAQQTINVGAAPNDGTGDPARTAFGKINGMFTELYASVASLIAAVAASLPVSARGAANGVASLDGTGKVPAAQLPASSTSSPYGTPRAGTISGGVATFDLSLLTSSEDFFTLTLTGNVAITFTNGVAGKSYDFPVLLTQDGTGGRTATAGTGVTPTGSIVPAGAAASTTATVRFASADGTNFLHDAAGTDLTAYTSLAADGANPPVLKAMGTKRCWTVGNPAAPVVGDVYSFPAEYAADILGSICAVTGTGTPSMTGTWRKAGTVIGGQTDAPSSGSLVAATGSPICAELDVVTYTVTAVGGTVTSWFAALRVAQRA